MRIASNITAAGNAFLDNPLEAPSMPNWSRVHAACPDPMARSRQAADADNE